MVKFNIFNVIYLVCFLVAVPIQAERRGCWVCEHVANVDGNGSEKMNDNCTDPFPKTFVPGHIEIHDCQTGYNCVKRVTKDSNGTGIDYQRTCEANEGVETGCKTEIKEGKEYIECYCNGRLCNTARTGTAASSLLFIGLLSVVTSIYLF